MSTPAIRTEGLTKHYGEVEALNDLDLEVHAGEVFGFLGPNGAGKTTMIRTILDLIRPTRGRAEILGLDTHEAAVEIRRRIGYLPSDLSMYDRLTGRDTILRRGARNTPEGGPVAKGGRLLIGKPAEGGAHPGVHEQAAGAHHGRAEQRARPPDAT